MDAYSDEKEIDMSKTLGIALVLGALGAGVTASSAQAATDMGSQCRAHAYSVWQQGRNGDGLDRQREFIINSCMANGGHF
jgi:hypothetical protein